MNHTHEIARSGGYYDSLESSPLPVFNPEEYIVMQEDGFALCRNPMVDGGLSALTVNTRLSGQRRSNFEASIKRMVLAKLFSPKFAEVILTATRMNHHG